MVVELVKWAGAELDGARFYTYQRMSGASEQGCSAMHNAVRAMTALLAMRYGSAGVSTRQMAACAATFSDQSDR